MSTTCNEVCQQPQQLYSPCQQPSNTGPQTTATSELFDFMSDTTVHTAGERSIKTENHGVSRDFWHFLDSSAIELDVKFNDLIFDLSLLRCTCFMHHAVLLWQVFSQAGFIVRSTKSLVSRN